MELQPVSVMEIYQSISRHIEGLKESKEVSDTEDRISDMNWVRAMLERTHEVNPKKDCKCPKDYHTMFKECRGY